MKIPSTVYSMCVKSDSSSRGLREGRYKSEGAGGGSLEGLCIRIKKIVESSPVDLGGHYHFETNLVF
jgi:hypothetical protein